MLQIVTLSLTQHNGEIALCRIVQVTGSRLGGQFVSSRSSVLAAGFISQLSQTLVSRGILTGLGLTNSALVECLLIAGGLRETLQEGRE